MRRLDYFESVKGDKHSCLLYLEFDEHVTEDVAVQDGKTKLLDTQRVTIVEGPRRRTVLEGSITKKQQRLTREKEQDQWIKKECMYDLTIDVDGVGSIVCSL